jgi:hypothetical protein
MKSSANWSAPLGKQAVYILIGLMAPIIIFFLILYLVTDNTFWLGPLVLGAGAGVGTLIMVKMFMGSQAAYTSKAYDGKPMEIVERINDVLVDAEVEFERKGSTEVDQGPSTLETFVIDSDDMTIEIVDRLGIGVMVLVGPMDEFNKTVVERYQGIIDSAKTGERPLFGND